MPSLSTIITILLSFYIAMIKAVSGSNVLRSTPMTKSLVRSTVKERIKLVDACEIALQSEKVFESLIALKQYQSCDSVCIYLSMPCEIQTYSIVRHALLHGKRVFIPKVIGKQPNDMIMYELISHDMLESFTKNKWGIPEPPLPAISVVTDSDGNVNYNDAYLDEIKSIIVPGVAFDNYCGRIGHGKGYYDCFLDKIRKHCIDTNKDTPLKIGLSLEQQIFDHVEMEKHDQYLDYVITPSAILSRASSNEAL